MADLKDIKGMVDKAGDVAKKAEDAAKENARNETAAPAQTAAKPASPATAQKSGQQELYETILNMYL